jgi:hypothetical protein
MKITLSIDCTPTEARQMVGLPDLLPLHECLALALEDCLTLIVAGLAAPADDAGAAAAVCHDRQHRRRTG